MKKIFLLGMLLIYSMVCGCTSRKPLSDTQSDAHHESSSLILEVDSSKVDKIERAKIYTSEFWQWDEEKLVDMFIGTDEVQKEIEALGPAYRLMNEKEERMLLLWDGGKQFGKKTGIGGGFRYLVDMRVGNNEGETIFDYRKILDMQLVVSTLESKNKDYPDAREEELSFQSYVEAKKEVEEIIQEIGFPGAQEIQTYSITSEIAQQHIELLPKEEQLVWTEKDEAYMFIYGQVIDGIPIVKDYWGESPIQVGDAPNAYLTIIKDADGIVEIECEGFQSLTNDGEEHDLIPYEQALEVIREKYAYTTEKTVVKNAALRYMAIQKEEGYELIPAWFFTVWQEDHWENQGKDEVTIEELYHAVNAVTGKLMGNKG